MAGRPLTSSLPDPQPPALAPAIVVLGTDAGGLTSLAEAALVLLRQADLVAAPKRLLVELSLVGSPAGQGIAATGSKGPGPGGQRPTRASV
jgi:hypothetical protein